jgi:hypothetical protein
MGLWFWAGTRDFSRLQKAQTFFGTHLSYWVRGFIPRGWSDRTVKLTTKTWPCNKEKNVWSFISLSPCVFMLWCLGLIKHKATLTSPFSVEYWNSACKWKTVEGSLPQSTDHVVQRTSANLFDTLHLKKEIIFFLHWLYCTTWRRMVE